MTKTVSSPGSWGSQRKSSVRTARVHRQTGWRSQAVRCALGGLRTDSLGCVCSGNMLSGLGFEGFGPTLCNPMDCNLPDSSVHGILQARILQWVTLSFSRDLPDPGIKPGSPSLQADSLPSEPPGKQIQLPKVP